MPKEQYMCQLCANHGIFNQPKKGHKQKCPFRSCLCDSCGLNTKRRALDQIERKLRVKDSPSPPVLERQTTNMPTTIPFINHQFNESSEISTDIITNISPTYQSNFVSSSQSINIPSMINFSVPLPPTVPMFSKVNMKSNLNLNEKFVEEKKNDKERSSTVESNQSLYILTKEDGIENVSKERRSIFHSVEMLAKEET
uniref:DM domain-containing protein n=1 Tax=Strongyloides stercoralis TaxID=6248 RepID=A0A0K0E0I5_STRER